jgi:amino acid transporter
LRKQNRGIALLIIAIVFLILAVLLIVVYTEDVNRRNSQISAFKEFAANHNYPLNTGTVSFTNIITLDMTTFEQKCTELSTENGFQIIEQNTHTWLIFPQTKFSVVDRQTDTVYQWIV